MDVRIVHYDQRKQQIYVAVITDNNGYEWLYSAVGLGSGENYNCWRTLDVVYEDALERDRDSGYYATSLDHALHILDTGGF